MVRRTKEEAQETRQRLLDAAEVLFQSQGVSQTTLQQIAQKAGATRGAIYWHFKDKADLFNAMMDRVTLPLEAAVQQATKDDGSMESVETMMVEALKLMTTDPQMRRVFEVATHKVEYTHDMQSVHRRHLDARNECVVDFEKAMVAEARRTRTKLPIPAAQAAQGLHALINGLIQNWLLDPEAFDLVATGRRTFRVYLAGLGFGKPEPSGA
ncbi:TetR family transcriptional regulator [Variovorax sp. YR216]|uniref:TetR family transcriptional regulator n=1 Tax=Variovorax sp. YR216 TaxID=1882828 RepID=UPI00089644AA|nr:TetR family transcriptional regulator [Variovorax sp. YR216]SEA67589.1 transcriptional regulator, TetR family [Variovorax sp. YR216]